MAPRGRRGEASEPQALHELGVQGRVTGVTLARTGEVDDQGFQPLDSLFSSPQAPPAAANGDDDDDDDDDDDGSGSEEMEIPSSSGPGPQTVLRGQRSFQYPPRSRSPVKTHLMSPARRNPHLDRGPSEDRVTRKLDFNGRMSAGRGGANGTNGVAQQEVEEEEEEPEAEYPPMAQAEDPPMEFDDGPYMDDGGGPDMVDPPEDVEDGSEDTDTDDDDVPEEVEPPPPSPPKTKGRAPMKGKQPAVATHSPLQRPRKRPSPAVSRHDDQEGSREEEYQEQESPRAAKRPRTTKQPQRPPPSRSSKSVSVEPAGSETRGRGKGKPGRKPKPKQLQTVAEEDDDDDDAGESSFMALQKGPPMPKRRGLVSVRRDRDTVLQTRSGRHSYKPLNWWAGEQVITEDEERRDMFTNDRGFVLPSMKEIVRVREEEEEKSKRSKRGRGRPKSSKPRAGGGRRSAEDQDDDDDDEPEEPEEWEEDPGTVVGDIIAWEPEYETHPPGDDDHVHISEEQIAVSGDAVQTRDIRDATFRFAKTLTIPFMGAGIVDLPPGAEKRPKNSRKMHMVFFVHYGKVAVTVNEGQFRISAGGQWFVPRGNYYSITNDYQRPARIFFAQACEVSAQQPADAEQSTLAPGS